MPLNWINPQDYTFNSFLLLERFQIRLMFDQGGWRNNKVEWKRSMGIALNANPAVQWYFAQRCPECAVVIDELTAGAPVVTDPAGIRKAEEYALLSVEDFVIHTTPEAMAANCQYIRDWDKWRLYEMADFDGKVVLDVGAGSGRLTFAAAEKAAWVYAAEPVGTLREFIRDKVRRDGVTNVRVTEALVTHLPYPDDIFDIVMSGHVVGDEWDAEIAELTRVCKPGGWLLDCPGDESGRGDYYEEGKDEALKRGWELMRYTGNSGGDVFRYRKQIL